MEGRNEGNTEKPITNLTWKEELYLSPNFANLNQHGLTYKH